MSLHHTLDRWSETVLLHALEKHETVRYVVVQISVEGLTFLMDPELGEFTKMPAKVKRFTLKSEACAAMAQGYDAMKATYGSKVAGLYWKGQRVIPIYAQGEPYADLPQI